MRMRSPAFLAVSLTLALIVPGVASAQGAKTPSPADLSADGAKVKLANGLVVLGRAEKDPLMMTVAVKLLAGLDAPVVDPASTAGGGEAKDYDLAALIEEARGFAGGDQAILDMIKSTPVTMSAGERGTCGWDWQCNAIECGWVYSCGW